MTEGAGTTLTDYPRPSVAVDVAVLTVHESALFVVTVDSPRGLALPGTFLHPGERLSDAAHRVLQSKAGITALQFHQIGMFDAPDRDDRGWVLSMAHGAAVPYGSLPIGVKVVRIEDDRPSQPLSFDHSDMVVLAVEDLRRRYASNIDPSLLLGEEFTMLELKQLYEVVFGNRFPKDTFRRHVSPALDGTGATSVAAGGRPAELYRRKAGAVLPETASALLRS